MGGLAATDDLELATMMKSLLNHGRDGIYLSMDDDRTTDAKELLSLVELTTFLENDREVIVRTSHPIESPELAVDLKAFAMHLLSFCQVTACLHENRQVARFA